MFRYIHSLALRFFLAVILCLTCGSAVFAEKPLSEKDRLQLSDIAKRHYEATMMEGASVFRFKGRDILVVIIEVKKSPNAQRVGQVKSSRSAGEFLQSATNKSITVYEVSDGSSYSMQDRATERGSSSGAVVSDNISQGTSDITTMETEEHFSDEIVQSSMTRVGHIEPLCRLSADGTTLTFAYFLVLEK